jgi:hypothetical protein
MSTNTDRFIFCIQLSAAILVAMLLCSAQAQVLINATQESSERVVQLTPKEFEQELAKADAEYAKTGSSQPYEKLQQKLINSWDLKDNHYYQLIILIGKRAEEAKKSHPIRNSPAGQIYHGERSMIPRF